MKEIRYLDLSNIDNLRTEAYFGGSHIIIDTGGYCLFDYTAPRNQLHSHNFFELCYVISGSGEYFHDGSVYKLKSGDVFVSDCNIVHEIRIVPDEKGNYKDDLHLVYFSILINTDESLSGSCYEETVLKSFVNNHKIICESCYYLSSYLNLIESFGIYRTGENYGLIQAVNTLVLECLISLSSNEVKKYRKSYESILDQAVNFISKNINKKLSIADIAKNSFTSERNLQHLFRKHLNSTIIGYINTRRMNNAANYLKMNFRVSDVSAMVGISDPAQFCRLFKKYYHMAPKEYQKQFVS